VSTTLVPTTESLTTEGSAVAFLAVEHGYADLQLVYTALTHQPNNVVEALTSIDDEPAASRENLYRCAAAALNVPYVNPSDDNAQPDIDRFQRLDPAALLTNVAIPLSIGGKTILAAGVPSSPSISELAAHGNIDTVALADPQLILAALRRVSNERETISGDRRSKKDEQDTAAARRRAPTPTLALDEKSNLGWTRDLLERAIIQRASDIHLSLTLDSELRIAYRVDGELRPQIVTDIDPDRALNTMITRAGMDIGAKNTTQSASFDHRTQAGARYNVRAELLPALNGPEITLRLLASGGLMTLDQMGLNQGYVKRLKRATERSDGLILVTGPTGHGKTTTLYGALLEVKDGRRKIIAIEDPVEYRIDGLTQVQVAPNVEGGLGWLQAISSSLRSDPDVMLIGEIRDAATANAAVQASQTGHLVLSTLHANNAVAAYARLRSLGVDPVEVAAQTVLITGQRLIPRLHSCSVLRDVSDIDRIRLAASGVDAPNQAHYPAGCDGCDGQGTKGRVPLVEMLSPDPTLRDAVAAGAHETELGLLTDETNLLSFAAEAQRLMVEGAASPTDIASRLREADVNIAAETTDADQTEH